MTSRRFAAIIPAAGLSSRMQGFKPLLPLGRSTVIERVIALFSEARIRQIIVVVGHNQAQLVPVLRKLGVQVVNNPDFRQGMFTSVLAGLRHMDPACDAFFLLPADIALVRPASIQRLAGAYDAHPGKIIHPIFRTQRGHPPLIPTALVPDILTWRQEGGLKGFFENHDHLSLQIPVADRHILFDIDTPANYFELRHRWESYAVPTSAECEVILSDIHPVSERTVRHGHKVAQIAERIGRALIQVGLHLDLELIRSGALLHDLAKGRKDHAEKGAVMIDRLGFSRLSCIVGAHTNLIPDPEGRISETEVVFMADKVVSGDQVIPMARRFQEPLERWADDPSAVDIILKRRATAYLVKDRIEALLGRSIAEVIDDAPS